MKISILLQISILTLLSFLSTAQADVSSTEEAQELIDSISNQIDKNRHKAELYIKRGDLYFLTHDFDNAVDDFSLAIKLDPSLDAAWYGRGMAQGRRGYIKEGIADLSVYLKKNPNDSKAFTKRGVRYLWNGEKENARQDLLKAIKLNPDNAEAHDDLGVVLAQMGNYKKAIKHFSTTVSIDPSYQKGHHNLAMALYATENDIMALHSVNKSLRLKPESRDSMLLKSLILTAMGQHIEAKRIENEAAFLPAPNWHESAPIK